MWQVIIGVMLGFALGLIPPWWVRRRRLLGHWRVLRVEIEACGRFAQSLLDEQVQSPLYRLPVLSYEISYPAILADGAPTGPEISTLTKFFGHVLEVNRGLDNADEWLKIGDDGKLKRERDRINLMAGKIAPSHPKTLSTRTLSEAQIPRTSHPKTTIALANSRLQSP